MLPSGHFSSNRYVLHRVAECDVATSHKAKIDTTVLHRATSPCSTAQQKPLAEPLVLTLNLQETKEKQKKLTQSQCKLAEIWATQLISKFPGEFYVLSELITDCEKFLLTDQSDKNWNALGNGLPNPKNL